jgi:hypothetical protein
MDIKVEKADLIRFQQHRCNGNLMCILVVEEDPLLVCPFTGEMDSIH